MGIREPVVSCDFPPPPRKVFSGSGRWPVLKNVLLELVEISQLNMFYCEHWYAVMQGICKCLPAVLQGDDGPGRPTHVGRSYTPTRDGEAYRAP